MDEAKEVAGGADRAPRLRSHRHPQWFWDLRPEPETRKYPQKKDSLDFQ